MFIKPVRPKSNVQLKSSDRKKLQTRIAAHFADCSTGDLQLLLPSKATVSQLKLVTHGDTPCTVYAVDRLPMFFETQAGVLLPTLYAMWLVPTLLPAMTTHEGVLPVLAKGANLMLPGRFFFLVMAWSAIFTPSLFRSIFQFYRRHPTGTRSIRVRTSQSRHRDRG